MKLVILDRDGVINYDSEDYIKSEEEWEALPGSLEAIAKLHQHNYHIAVITNQSGIARGLYTLEDMERIHAKMQKQIAKHGGAIDAIFFCPHGPDDNCECRKPKPGLLKKISEQFNTSLTDVPFVGDKLADVEAAQAVHAKPVLVKTGYGKSLIEKGIVPAGVDIYNDLATFVDALIE